MYIPSNIDFSVCGISILTLGFRFLLGITFSSCPNSIIPLYNKYLYLGVVVSWCEASDELLLQVINIMDTQGILKYQVTC